MRNWSDVIDGVSAHFNRTLGSVALSHPEPGTQPATDQSRPTEDEEVKAQRLTMEEVEDHLRDPINLCAELARYLRKLLLLALVLVFVQSYLYLCRYLSRYSFDNMFITPRLKEIDIERRRMGLHGVFPLRRRERMRYVDLTSWKLSPLEKSQSKSALVVFVFHMLIYGMVLLVDFLLFYLLTLMTRQLKNEHSPATTSPKEEVEVSGNGFLEKLLTGITSSFANDSSSPADFTQDFHACLIDFNQIDLWSIWSTLAMYLATLLIILLHGYGSRLRQRILAFYYPLQHEARTQHLYLNIYIKRKSFIREARDMIQPCVAAGEETEGFLERKAAGVALFRSLCPCLKEPVFKCHNCKRYSSHMLRCSGEGCSTILCRDCLVDSSGLCPHCIDVEEEEESEEYLSDNATKNLISA